ncbi:unnamed protein product, partial [Strongylus vulgaris]
MPGVHRGSVLPPLHFITVMDAITDELNRQRLRTLRYADEVVLLAESRGELEEEVQTYMDRRVVGAARREIEEAFALNDHEMDMAADSLAPQF